MQNITKITLAWELYEAGLLKTEIAKRLGVNRDTIRLWFKEIQNNGLSCFLDSYLSAKKGSRVKRQINPILKRWVWEIRERESDCCGQKINYFLLKEHGVSVSTPKIYEILKEKLIIKSKWKKNQARGPIPKAKQPREVIQMDSIDFGGLYAFTGIDIYTREADILIAPKLTAEYGCQFLRQSMERRFNGYVNLLQTDGGPEFKDKFKDNIHQYCLRHRIARPYRKNEQSYIESFNRTVRKECLGWIKYNTNQLSLCTKLVEEFLERYHYHRPHLSLGLRTPLTRS